MMEESEKILYCLAGVLMENEKREAEAVEGYNEQLKLISEAKTTAEGDFLSFLENLEAATNEKISDELNHGKSLLEEYVALTGISPAED